MFNYFLFSSFFVVFLWNHYKQATNMREQRIYPVGIQDFEKLRKEKALYVDKTDLIYNLTRKYYVFLSRPRRFGKSLLSSTLKYYFQGRKDLPNLLGRLRNT